MAERLFGMEIEYGCAAYGRGFRHPALPHDWTDRLLALARERLPHLSAMDGGGIFLRNGARFYTDCGHPEMTTPECANPWDVARYMQAGERVLSGLAEELRRREPALEEVLLFKTNVDATGTTWGCHTSFLHRMNPAALPAQILPHLVSRIIYTGAGGVIWRHGQAQFAISPRVSCLQTDVSAHSTRERGIFHTKDEALAGQGYHRLHVICGESLCSDTSLWLSMGTTALVVVLAEAGFRPGAAVELADPLAAMGRFSSDPTCRATALLRDGTLSSAVQIQRRYLELAEAQVGHPLMPPWADRVCVVWRALLDRLEHGAPASVATTLDWAIKLGVFLRRAGQKRMDWNPRAPEDPAAPETPEEDMVVTPGLQHALYLELCELDVRFGQLGGRGLFSRLDAAGALDHRISGVDNIEHAMAHPPAIGRARLRGECVARYAGQNPRYTCGWRGVIDREQRQLLDLSEPFTATEKWVSLLEARNLSAY